jgi:hypothetical protein
MGVVVMTVAEPNYPAKADALFADLYELTMMQAYLRERLNETAVFSLFVRRLPPTRNFLIACGLETVLDFLEHVRFSKDDISYLSSLNLFTPEFLGWLLDFHFTGDVFAVPEGTPVFGNEPILEIVAPLPQAQYFETFVMNQIHLQTLLASKAARVVTAARGRKFSTLVHEGCTAQTPQSRLPVPSMCRSRGNIQSRLAAAMASHAARWGTATSRRTKLSAMPIAPLRVSIQILFCSSIHTTPLKLRRKSSVWQKPTMIGFGFQLSVSIPATSPSLRAK